MSTDERMQYRAEQEGDIFRVVDVTGRVMLECGNGPTAHHYVDLLNKAYHAGYRQGYRAGKTWRETT